MTMADAAQVRVADLLDRAKAAGVLRSDVVPEDLVLIVLGNAEVVARTRDEAPQSWRRYAGLMLEALRARADAVPLPAPPSASVPRPGWPPARPPEPIGPSPAREAWWP